MSKEQLNAGAHCRCTSMLSSTADAPRPRSICAETRSGSGKSASHNARSSNKSPCSRNTPPPASARRARHPSAGRVVWYAPARIRRRVRAPRRGETDRAPGHRSETDGCSRRPPCDRPVSPRRVSAPRRAPTRPADARTARALCGRAHSAHEARVNGSGVATMMHRGRRTHPIRGDRRCRCRRPECRGGPRARAPWDHRCRRSRRARRRASCPARGGTRAARWRRRRAARRASDPSRTGPQPRNRTPVGQPTLHAQVSSPDNRSARWSGNPVPRAPGRSRPTDTSRPRARYRGPGGSVTRGARHASARRRSKNTCY